MFATISEPQASITHLVKWIERFCIVKYSQVLVGAGGHLSSSEVWWEEIVWSLLLHTMAEKVLSHVDDIQFILLAYWQRQLLPR